MWQLEPFEWLQVIPIESAHKRQLEPFEWLQVIPIESARACRPKLGRPTQAMPDALNQSDSPESDLWPNLQAQHKSFTLLVDYCTLRTVRAGHSNYRRGHDMLDAHNTRRAHDTRHRRHNTNCASKRRERATMPLRPSPPMAGTERGRHSSVSARLHTASCEWPAVRQRRLLQLVPKAVALRHPVHDAVQAHTIASRTR